jgi:hypothetical protein
MVADSGMSQKAYPVVIARRNDEAIRLFSGISGLLHSVRNDESGLLRHPRQNYLSPSSFSFVCSPEIKTRTDDRLWLLRQSRNVGRKYSGIIGSDIFYTFVPKKFHCRTLCFTALRYVKF